MTITAVTHNGIFHADDVFAAAVIKMIDRKAVFHRTRNLGEVGHADIVFDVGGVYDPATGKFDHHQRGGAGARPNGIKYAAFGLVWHKFGPGLVGEEVAQMVDARLVQVVDAGDNGQEISTPAIDGVHPYGVSKVISSFNPSWHESKCVTGDTFQQAVDFALSILVRTITMCEGEILARDRVRAAITGAKAMGTRVIILNIFCPWQQVAIEESDALFVLYPAETGDTWMVQCIPPAMGSFEKRKPLPAAWAGLRGSALADVTGVGDAVFCHPGCFICGAETLNGALRLAELALEEAHEN
jgi:uncharacterized UPF0160 family protein